MSTIISGYKCSGCGKIFVPYAEYPHGCNASYIIIDLKEIEKQIDEDV